MRETPVELKHSGSIYRKDVTQMTDEELMARITVLAAEIGFGPIDPAKTINAKPVPARSDATQDRALRLLPAAE